MIKKLIILAFPILFIACNRTPDHVIKQDDMAELMADMQLANAVVDAKYEEYLNDSLKKVLKQSVLIKHNISKEKFDTSLYWYGQNLDIYKEVYDNVIEILKERQEDIIEEAKIAGEQMTVTGDSVDIWENGKATIISNYQIGNMAELKFSIPADVNSRNGDKYEWNMFLLNGGKTANAALFVDYDNGTTEYQSKEFRMDEMNKILIQSDSTLTVTRLYGYMRYNLKDESSLFVDSISLYRSRLNAGRYNYHNYQHKVR